VAGAASGRGEALVGTADAEVLTWTTGGVTTGVDGRDGNWTTVAGIWAAAEGALGTGAGAAATEGASTGLAWASAALTAAWAATGTSASAGATAGATVAAVAACAPAGMHSATVRSAKASAHAIRCPNNFRNLRSTMISFLFLMSPRAPDLIQKSRLTRAISGTFTGDIGRIGDVATWVAIGVGDRR
jgi:hypothetical protein